MPAQLARLAVSHAEFLEVTWMLREDRIKSSKLNEGVNNRICAFKSPANILITLQQSAVARRGIDQIYGVQDPS